MGLFPHIFGLCLIAQGMASPLHTLVIPYMQGLFGFPWVGHRGMVPQVSPVVVELETQFTCTTNGSFPDPETCNKYYQCNFMPNIDNTTSELKAFIFDCPPGLEFDATQKMCDYPTGEDCKHQGQVPSCTELTGEERTLCQERLNIPQVSPVVIELDTEYNCTVEGTFADPDSCDKYYTCLNISGTIETFQFDCPPTLLFNAVDKLCDRAETVNCNRGFQEIDICSSSDLTDEQRNRCLNKPCARLTGDEKTLCQERLNIPQVSPVIIERNTTYKCTVKGTFADPDSCDKYYECVEFDEGIETFRYDCPPTLLFNAVDKLCDRAATVNCDRGFQELDICSSPELTDEQRNRCLHKPWKQFDHFRK